MYLPPLSFHPAMPVQTQPKLPAAEPAVTPLVRFQGQPKREEEASSDPEKVQEYLKMLRAFPSASRVLFVRIFAMQLSDDNNSNPDDAQKIGEKGKPVRTGDQHIRMAVEAGKQDKHIKELNDIIVDHLKKRFRGTPAEQAESAVHGASLDEAQQIFLREIGRGDLVERFFEREAQESHD